MDIEELLIKAVGALLVAPSVKISDAYTTDAYGNNVNVSVAHPGDPIINQIVQTYITAENKAVIAKVVIDHISAHPELLAIPLAQAFEKWFNEYKHNARQGDVSPFFNAFSQEFTDMARDTAAAVLKENKEFRDRVIDMAHLSDSDNIHVSIELKPKGQ